FFEFTSAGSPFINSRQRWAASTTRAKRLSSCSKQSSTVTRAMRLSFGPGRERGAPARSGGNGEANRRTSGVQRFDRAVFGDFRLSSPPGTLHGWEVVYRPAGRISRFSRNSRGAKL